MDLIKTVVGENTVSMRFADCEDAAKAKHWIDFQVPIDPDHDPAPVNCWFLFQFQAMAIQALRARINREADWIKNSAAEADKRR